MKKRSKKSISHELQPEYDFHGGVRGKYAHRFAEGSNVVVLEPDVAQIFPDSQSVNRSLRSLAGNRSPAIVREKPAKKYGSRSA
jgi:hypothetical protein